MKRRICAAMAAVTVLLASCARMNDGVTTLRSARVTWEEQGTVFSADVTVDDNTAEAVVVLPEEICGVVLTFETDGAHIRHGDVALDLPEGCADVLYMITRTFSPPEAGRIGAGREPSSVLFDDTFGGSSVSYDITYADGVPLHACLSDGKRNITVTYENAVCEKAE